MKTKLTQRRYRAPKRSACAMCKPHQRGWADKKTPGDLRRAVGHEGEMEEGKGQMAERTAARPET